MKFPVQAPTLALPNKYRVLDAREDDACIYLDVEGVELHTVCPYCKSKNVRPWGSVSPNGQVFVDTPYRNKHVQLNIDRKRQRCGDCKKTFAQPLAGMAHTHWITERLMSRIGEQGRTRTFTAIAKETGLVEATVRHVFSDFMRVMEERIHISTPPWMSLVTIQAMQKPRLMALNAQNWFVMDILGSCSEEAVNTYLGGLRDPLAVLLVGMPFNRAYRDGVAKHLPNALAFIDKAYMLELVAEGLDKARAGLRAEMTHNQRRGLAFDGPVMHTRYADLDEKAREVLQERFARLPMLGAAYHAKEALCAVYDVATNGREALKGFADAIDAIDMKLQPYFADVSAALRPWAAEIGAYFESDACKAGISTLGDRKFLGQIVDAAGRGYSFEAVRAKLLFPERYPGRSMRSPGVSVDRLRRELAKQASPK